MSRWNRRRFLKTASAGVGTLALGADSLLAGQPVTNANPEIVVVGAGAFGGWTALYLREMGFAVTMIDQYGPDRICVAGACDWGPSDPIAVPRFAMEMRRRKLPEDLIHRVIFENPVTFLRQSGKFHLPPGVEALAAQ